MAAKIEQGMQAKQNEGMASTQVMLRVADILNERGTIDDVEPALRGAVAQELGFYLNPRKIQLSLSPPVRQRVMKQINQWMEAK
ncbi:hypothetical protein [Lacticaseibacillus saniviri]|uniref:hypothetical protein n=1 Tax=Lacticaseibacillus saniviri TaxID=931533 RepID=UPI0006D23615|nr:hypothetical protein [Lacticaseibacillus saniviri]